VIIAAVVTIIGVAAAGALGLGGRRGARTGPDTAPQVATVQITVETLVNATTIDGKLNHGPEVPISLPAAAGTVTWLPASGASVHRGEPLLRVDDRPVVLLYGDLPMYRRLAEPPATPTPAPGTAPPTPGPSQPLRGRDVKQFEANLRDLGYSGFTVDETYTAQTAQAVKRWQKDLGVAQTGAVEVADVVYLPGAVRVARGLARIGARATGDVLTCTGTARVVTVNAPAGDAAWAVVGTGVEVVLPDRRTVAGSVASVGADVTPPATAGNTEGAGATQNPTIPVVITIADQNALGSLDSSPVTVRFVVEKRENVLTVPVATLVALAEGGYGLEVLDGGSSRYVPVQPGLFADGRVEVAGPGIQAGTTVRIPQ
jgi:peptidoglycan hydrolase-like protein with peptidoglycan-binding domain